MISWCKSHPNEEEQYFKLFEKLIAHAWSCQTICRRNKPQEHIFRILQSNQDYNKLASIAESGVDIDEITELLAISHENSIDFKSIINVLKMAGTVGISMIESFAAEKYEEELDRQFKETLGTNIEIAFKEAFEKYAVSIEIIRDPLGQDFTLILPDGNHHKVEIKSVANGSRRALLSKLQGKTAVQNQRNYTLCVMERPVGNLYPDRQEFENLSRFVKDIGSLVNDKVKFADSIERTLTDYAKSGINIEFENFDYKFSVERTVWQDSLSFSKFVDYLISAKLN